MPEGGTEYIPDLIYDHTSRRAIQEEAFRKGLGQQVNLKSGEKLFEFGVRHVQSDHSIETSHN